MSTIFQYLSQLLKNYSKKTQNKQIQKMRSLNENHQKRTAIKKTSPLRIYPIIRSTILIFYILTIDLYIRTWAYIPILTQNNKIKNIIRMYRGTPYLNRKIKRREEQRSMEYHLSNLNHIRPRTGTIEQVSDVQINNRKGEMQKEAKFTEIERENRILLEKISMIMGKQSRKGSSQLKINRSLNSELRKRQLHNIEIENAKLLKRLQQRKPNYQTQKFKQSWRKQKYVIKNMSNYPFIINDHTRRKRSSISHLGSSKETNPNTIQLCRMRLIDGVSFLVTVRMTQQKMQIIGDTKDKREIKVIEINRDEAIQFIQQECQGKIEKIFDCLRYDKAEEVLYLVANEVQLEDVKNQENGNTKKRQNPQFNLVQDISLPSRANDQNKTSTSNPNPKKQKKPTQQKQKTSNNNEQDDIFFNQISNRKKSKPSETKLSVEGSQGGKVKDNFVESSVNTYHKIKRFTEESDVQKNKKQDSVGRNKSGVDDEPVSKFFSDTVQDKEPNFNPKPEDISSKSIPSPKKESLQEQKSQQKNQEMEMEFEEELGGEQNEELNENFLEEIVE